MSAPKLKEEAAPELIAGVERTFGRLTVDLAATDEDHKAPKWITPERDTFTVNWAEEIGEGIGWLNPPPLEDGGLMPWFEKCVAEGKQGARFLVITDAAIDSYEFWEYLLPNALIYVLYPRMAYQGEPKPLVLGAFNIRHKEEKDVRLTQIRLWNWMTGLTR